MLPPASLGNMEICILECTDLMKEQLRDKKIILFDGLCNLCSAFLNFVYQNDNKKVFHFSWIQSDVATEILEQTEILSDKPDSIIFIRNGISYFKSDAFLEIVLYLKLPWPLMRAGKILPRVFRDWIYDLVARNRYRWFGKKDQCMIPTGDLKDRFL